MAKITFLAPVPPDLSCFGVRSLSAYLRQKGHETRIIFLPGNIGKLKLGGDFKYEYNESVLERCTQLCAGADLVGISFMTSYFDRAVQLTKSVRSKGIPVVWGGVHPTLKPAEGLEYADYVCVGEGEDALDMMLRSAGRDFDITGVWDQSHKKSGNGVLPLCPDLNKLPYFDFSNLDHYLITDDGTAQELNDAQLESNLPFLPGRGGKLYRAYRTMTDRGCPHNCSYCNVPTVKKIFRDDDTPYFRQRSPQHVLGELEQIKSRFPFVERIQFFDDTFFAKPLSWFEEFVPEYKKRIDIPFHCQASPSTLDAEKLDLLISAGLEFVEMGVQSGSEKIRNIYRREDSDSKIIAGAELLKSREDKLLPPVYHVIINSPWETETDLLETVRLLARLPKPYSMAISSLTFFPCTELYYKAIEEGFLLDDRTQIYRAPFYIPPQETYPGFVLYLLTFQHFPMFLSSFLLRERCVDFFSSVDARWVYRIGFRCGEFVRLAVKGTRAVLAGDFKRIVLWGAKKMKGNSVTDGRSGQ